MAYNHYNNAQMCARQNTRSQLQVVKVPLLITIMAYNHYNNTGAGSDVRKAEHKKSIASSKGIIANNNHGL